MIHNNSHDDKNTGLSSIRKKIHIKNNKKKSGRREIKLSPFILLLLARTTIINK